MKISVDWDGTCEFKSVQNEVIKWLKMGHYVEIVTTRYRDPVNYLWYREGLDDDIHKELFSFARKANIPYHFTNMEYKAKYLEENNFDYLVDDNIEEKIGLDKCKFIREYDVSYLTDKLESNDNTC